MHAGNGPMFHKTEASNDGAAGVRWELQEDAGDGTQHMQQYFDGQHMFAAAEPSLEEQLDSFVDIWATAPELRKPEGAAAARSVLHEADLGAFLQTVFTEAPVAPEWIGEPDFHKHRHDSAAQLTPRGGVPAPRQAALAALPMTSAPPSATSPASATPASPAAAAAGGAADASGRSPTSARAPGASLQRHGSSNSSSGSRASELNKHIYYRRSWSTEDDRMLLDLVNRYGAQHWSRIAMHMPGKTGNQCSQRWHKALDPTIVKGKWREDEDRRLADLVRQVGYQWKRISQSIPGRTGKQCRDRYTARLDPGLKMGKWTRDEERIVREAHAQLGNKWAAIQKLLPHRSWYTIKWKVESLVKQEKEARASSNPRR